MALNLYPALKENILEVMDDDNTPLCLMPDQTVMRQKLRHRRVALLLGERTGKYLLTYRNADGWGLSSVDVLPAGRSCIHRAEELLLRDWSHEGRLRRYGTLPACPETGFAIVEVFGAKLPASLTGFALRTPDRHMLADPQELHGLDTHFGDLLSPLLRMTIQTFLHSACGGKQS